MHLIYLVVLLCALLAMNWRYLGLDRLFKRLGGGRAPRLSFGKPCRWKRDPMRRDGALDRYICTVCGVDAFTSDGRPPRQCKRTMRPGSL